MCHLISAKLMTSAYELNTFFQDFPLTYLRRKPAKEEEVKADYMSISDIKAQIISNEEFRNFIPGKKVFDSTPTTVYARLIKVEPYFPKQPYYFKNKINELLENNEINDTKFGFIHELNQKERISKFKLDDKEINDATYDQLFKFCFAHNMSLSHDVSKGELKRMAKWIVRNEADQISYLKMPKFLQQSIDLSVVTQNIDKLSALLDSDPRLAPLLKKQITESEEKLEMTQTVLQNTAMLNSFLTQHGQSLSAMKFQENALMSLQEPRSASEPAESEDVETGDEDN